MGVCSSRRPSSATAWCRRRQSKGETYFFFFAAAFFGAAFFAAAFFGAAFFAAAFFFGAAFFFAGMLSLLMLHHPTTIIPAGLNHTTTGRVPPMRLPVTGSGLNGYSPVAARLRCVVSSARLRPRTCVRCSPVARARDGVSLELRRVALAATTTPSIDFHACAKHASPPAQIGESLLIFRAIRDPLFPLLYADSTLKQSFLSKRIGKSKELFLRKFLPPRGRVFDLDPLARSCASLRCSVRSVFPHTNYRSKDIAPQLRDGGNSVRAHASIRLNLRVKSALPQCKNLR